MMAWWDGEMILYQLQIAKNEGLLEVNRVFCKQQMVQKHPPARLGIV